MAEEVHKMRESVSANLGVKYVAFKEFFLTEDGVRLNRSEVAGKTQKAVKELYTTRKTTVEPIDYEYARTTGYLRKKKQDLPSPELITPHKSDFDAQIVKLQALSPITFITIATVLIGFAMLIVSISYTHAHILKYTDPVVAWIFAIGLCSFNSIAFESSLLFWKMPKGKPLSVFFGVLFVVVLAFTVSANADVIYARCRSNQNTDVSSAATNESAAAVQMLTKNQADTKKKEVDAAQAELDTYVAGDKVSSWKTQLLRNALDKKKAEYNTLIEEQKKNLRDNPNIAKVTAMSSDSFYDFIGSKVGMKAGDVETLLNMLSILFVDIIAPASFAVALFLGGKQYGRKEESKRDAESVGA